MFCYLPANLIALGMTPPGKLKNAAGLYNLTRDLGGAITLALLGTVMTARLQFPLEPADRRHQPGARGGAAFSRHADGPVRRHLAR
jgi:MFS transporter, DHA2 family, multidrug resistance protein